MNMGETIVIEEDPKSKDLEEGEGQILKSNSTPGSTEDSYSVSEFSNESDHSEGSEAASSDFVSTLPASIQRRVQALKKLQAEHLQLETKYYEEIIGIECKYASLYNPLYEKRMLIVSAKVEPKDDDANLPLKNSDEHSNASRQADETIKGIPNFWLTALKNAYLTKKLIQVHDEPILKHLTDVKTKISHIGFLLEFYFEPNEFFTNPVLTKEYEMKCTPNDNDPFSFDGPDIHKYKGCPIDWKQDKNVTIRIITKKQKHRSLGLVRIVQRPVQKNSFFNFFNLPSVSDDEEQMDEDIQLQLENDFELGKFFCQRFVPRAVLFYTGEDLGDEYEVEETDVTEESEEEYEVKERKFKRLTSFFQRVIGLFKRNKKTSEKVIIFQQTCG